MNIVLWILQVALAFFSFAGGAFKVFKFDEMAKVPSTAALPQIAWTGIGIFEVLCAVLLVVPAATKWMPVLTPAAAAALAIEMLVLAVIDARYSLELAATNPMVWVIFGAVLAALVSYGRFAIKPIA